LNKKRVIIFANGSMGEERFFSGFFSHDDYIICADGGLKHAVKLGIKPDLIIGDMDSCGDLYKDFSCEIRIFPGEKDKTDTELALDVAKTFSPEEVIVIGALGNRIDHTLGNIYLFLKTIASGFRISILDSCQQIDFINKELSITNGKIGEILSLIPVTEKVTGIITSGLKYKLDGEELFLGETRGISNEIEILPAGIKIKEGILLCIRNFIAEI